MSIYKPSYPNEPDWQAAEDLFYTKTCEAIDRFVQEQPEKTLVFLCYYTQPDFTSAYIAFDSAENNLEAAKRREQYQIKYRSDYVVGEHAWRSAEYNIGKPLRPLNPYNLEVGDFDFDEYERFELEGWEDFDWSFLEDLPPKDAPEYDAALTKACKESEAYIKGHLVLILWRVIERLIAGGAIYKLKLAPAFMMGYSFHDEGAIVVVRIINWPDVPLA